MDIVHSLIRLLRPFKFVIQIIQQSTEPSFYYVLISVLTLRAALESISSLIAYEKSYYNDNEDGSRFDEEDPYESDGKCISISCDFALSSTSLGMLFFRTRISHLLDTMIDLKVEHFAAAMLHPRYRHLKKCSLEDIKRSKKYILKEMYSIAQMLKKESSISSESSLDPNLPPKKKQKRFGQQFESGNVSDEYDNREEEEELDRYLSIRLDFDKIEDNPLVFWKQCGRTFPILSILARRLHSIPATSASVERSFNGGGQVVNERRTNLSPSQVDNILFVRSVLLSDYLSTNTN